MTKNSFVRNIVVKNIQDCFAKEVDLFMNISGADLTVLISGGPNSEIFLSGLRKLFKRI